MVYDLEDDADGNGANKCSNWIDVCVHAIPNPIPPPKLVYIFLAAGLVPRVKTIPINPPTNNPILVCTTTSCNPFCMYDDTTISDGNGVLFVFVESLMDDDVSIILASFKRLIRDGFSISICKVQRSMLIVFFCFSE